jgi:hypothetical protein
MTLKTTYGPKNLRHTGLGPYVGARMVGPVCRTPERADNKLENNAVVSVLKLNKNCKSDHLNPFFN